MDKINIFDEVKQGEFFSFKNIGDSIQGTYIDARYNQIDSFQNQQNIYVIQDAEGKIWNIGFKLTNRAGNERMKQIRFGQIVGFRFDREQESKQPGRNKAKIILIYADPKFINEDWLSRQKELKSIYADSNSGPELKGHSEPEAVLEDNDSENDNLDESTMDKMFKAPADATAVSGAMPTAEVKPRNEALDAIRNLAKTKGLTNESMGETEADAVIEKYTGLKMVEENLTKVIIALTGYTKK